MAIYLSNIKSKSTNNGILKGNGSLISTVVSGTDLKTIKSTSLLGSGDISVTASSSGLIWDAGVVANLGTQAETSTISLSVKAITPFSGKTVTHTITSGSLPAGISLGSTTGLLTGTLPNLTGNTTYTFTVSATDTLSTISQQFTLTVSATNSVPTWTTAANLGTVSTGSVSIQLAATDAEGTTLTYSLKSGSSLPSGISLSSSGVLSGTNPLTGSTYTFTITVSDGVNNVDRLFSVILASPSGESVYTTPGTYSWTCPAGVTSVSVVKVNAGSPGGGPDWGSPPYNIGHGGTGGVLSYKNSISVSPGSSYTVVVGDGNLGTASSFINTSTSYDVNNSGGGSGSVGWSDVTYYQQNGAGGGGAGGYSGTGGYGAGSAINAFNPGSAGNGGAAGGGSSARPGGGVGLYGQGGNGTGGTTAGTAGGGGSNGSAGSGTTGGAYGGGGAGPQSNYGSVNQNPGKGGTGAVRIIWGSGRSFPSNAA